MKREPVGWESIAMAAFCGLTVVFLVVRDLMLPEARDTEVWFGFELRGFSARVTAPLHWLLYGFGCLAFARGARFIWPWAIGYSVLIALSHVVWNLSSASGGGWRDAIWQGPLFLVPTAGLVVLARRRIRATSRDAAHAP